MNISRFTIFAICLMLLLGLLSIACDESGDDDDDDAADDDTGDDDDDIDLPGACDEVFDPDQLPTYDIQIDPGQWANLQYEWANWADRMDEGLPTKPYHPLISFKYADEVVENAAIRLKGSELNWGSSPDKMQFNISFKQYDDSGRWHGMRKVNLDAPHNDPSMLRERIAFWYFRELGLSAPCANSARLMVNGEYYGLFTNIEHVDQEFLERNFGKDAAEGNLYKTGEKQTNESDPDISDWEQFDSELTLEQLEQLVDLEQAVQMWVGEAVIPQVDGYWAGGDNWYIYNHPQRGFVFIPWDNDYSFTVAGMNVDPITWEAPWGHGKPAHFLTMIQDTDWFLYFLETFDSALYVFDPEVLHAMIDQYAEQIAEAMDADANKPYSTDDHLDAIDATYTHVEQRQLFGFEWLDCKNGAGTFEEYEFGGRTFGVWHTSCSWHNALNYCQYLGGSLAVPLDADDQLFLTNTLLGLIDDDWWIGANDIDEDDVWTDPDGTILSYLPWGPDQPSESPGVDCATMDDYRDGLWAGDYCSRPHPSVCVMP
ncbi:MAG: CotH kinase family protein [Candidatus Alcyoniella australis]|nr:CotH kinase family protein [Candidatus Alcyoniella australis]